MIKQNTFPRNYGRDVIKLRQYIMKKEEEEGRAWYLHNDFGPKVLFCKQTMNVAGICLESYMVKANPVARRRWIEAFRITLACVEAAGEYIQEHLYDFNGKPLFKYFPHD